MGNDLDTLFNTFGKDVVNNLPKSPFADFINSLQTLPYLGWLNWVFPVEECMTILGVWASAVAIFYGAQIVLRWLKVIGN